MTLRERPTAGLLGVHFAAMNREAVDALHARAKAQGVTVTVGAGRPAAERRRRLRLPVPHARRATCSTSRPTSRGIRTSTPTARCRNKLSHVVLNSAKIEQQTSFFVDTLGFRLSD